jgi:hypothetical protein
VEEKGLEEEEDDEEVRRDEGGETLRCWGPAPACARGRCEGGAGGGIAPLICGCGGATEDDEGFCGKDEATCMVGAELLLSSPLGGVVKPEADKKDASREEDDTEGTVDGRQGAVLHTKGAKSEQRVRGARAGMLR